MELERSKDENNVNFSKSEQMTKTLQELERRLPVEKLMEQIRQPRPGKDRYPEFKPQVNDSVTIYRSDGSKDSGWIVDQVLSTPGNLTVAGLIKTEVGPNGPRRMDKVLTTDSFATLNISIEPEIQTDQGGDQEAIREYLKNQGRL